MSDMPNQERNERLYPKWHSSRYFGLVRLRQAIEGIVRKYEFKDKIVVDMGCGSMPYKPLFRHVVKKYLGADIPENESAEIHLEPQTSRVELEDGFADYVISTQVLEHVEAPEKYLREAHRICKANGRLVISTHGAWRYHPEPNDYWRWTASGLRKILEDNGWHVEETMGIFGFAASSMALFQDAVSEKLPRFLDLPFCVVMQQFINLLDKWYSAEGRTENATLYVMIARRT